MGVFLLLHLFLFLSLFAASMSLGCFVISIFLFVSGFLSIAAHVSISPSISAFISTLCYEFISLYSCSSLLNESCHTYEEICHTHKYVMSLHRALLIVYISSKEPYCLSTEPYILRKELYVFLYWMSHAPQMNKSCHTHECVMSHTWTRHVLHTNALVNGISRIHQALIREWERKKEQAKSGWNRVNVFSIAKVGRQGEGCPEDCCWTAEWV